MIELNLRIVEPGTALEIPVRHARIEGPSLTADLVELACSRLQTLRGLAAIPARLAGYDGQPGLIVATARPVQRVHLEGEDWELDVVDDGVESATLSFANPSHHAALTELVQRAVLIQVSRKTALWKINARPRTWYEQQPFACAEGVAAYRRYTISCLAIAEVGIGVAVDVGTGFFTSDTLAYFFDSHVPQVEQERRRRRFDRLVERQRGRKGTLLYDNSKTFSTAYFEKPPNGTTCASTGPIRLQGESYPSLFTYYRAKYPQLVVDANAPAVKVSFPGGGRPAWVVAGRVRASVMNDNVPRALKQVDKIAPADRKRLIEGFWRLLGSQPLGFVASGVADGFWRPDESRVTRAAPPALLFGNSGIVESPSDACVESYQRYFRRRQEALDRYGCYASPRVESRMIHCVFPESVSEEVVRHLADDAIEALRRWTQQDWRMIAVSYASFMDAVEELRHTDRGVALLVLDAEPTTYYDAAYHLQGWRLKRVTDRTLSQKYADLTGQVGGDLRGRGNRGRGQGGEKKRWQQFIEPTTLDLLLQMDAIPWRTLQPGHYDAQLIIDVGHDRRYYALSMLLMRDRASTPDFQIVARVLAKADYRQETINHVILADEIRQTVEDTFGPHERSSVDPIRSLLVLRDGRIAGRESEGIGEAVKRLRDDGLLADDARVDVVEIRKDSLKSLRLWEIGPTGEAINALEGTVVRLTDAMVMLTTTGRATLHQGTAEPLLLMGEGGVEALLRAADEVFCGAQLNWASPRVAQRLTLPLKRTDTELKARAAQEVRRLR